MKLLKLSAVALFGLIISGCSSSKIEMSGDTLVAYSPGDQVAIMRIEGLKTYYANLLYNDATQVFSKHDQLEIIDESDFIYELKTKGLQQPTFDTSSRSELLQIYEKSGVEFVIVSKVISLKNQIEESDFKQATIRVKLIDLRHQLATIDLVITTTMPPLVYKDNDGIQYEANVNSSISAASKAYNKGIKKLYGAFD